MKQQLETYDRLRRIFEDTENDLNASNTLADLPQYLPLARGFSLLRRDKDPIGVGDRPVSGRTLLHQGVIIDSEELVLILLAHFADVEARDNE